MDQHLQDCPHQTLIHGDFKCENLQFSKDGRSAAAVDFQYCGRGVPAKDLAYLLHTSVSRAVLAKEKELLAEYHGTLVGFLVCPCLSAQPRFFLHLFLSFVCPREHQRLVWVA